MIKNAAAGAFAGAAAAFGVLSARGAPFLQRGADRTGHRASAQLAEAIRESLPERIILVRHGESEGNADKTLYRTKPDNMIELTPNGRSQARAAGPRIKAIVGDDAAIELYVSPFTRTLQTARELRLAINPQIQKTHIDPRIREQEFGNIQRDDFETFRSMQKRVGRFWYRFPTGESGADVYGRVKEWWNDSIRTVNIKASGHARADSVVVVTHGLTMRLALMQLDTWSPTTFHSVWNASNCDLYVLKKNMSLPGLSPYALCPEEGDMPRSSLPLSVEFDDGRVLEITLNNYLSVPQPRTCQFEIVRDMIAAQNGISPHTIRTIRYHKDRELCQHDNSIPMNTGILFQNQAVERQGF